MSIENTVANLRRSAMDVRNTIAGLNRINAELEQAETEMKILIGGAVIDTGILDVLSPNQVLEHLVALRDKVPTVRQ